MALPFYLAIKPMIDKIICNIPITLHAIFSEHTIAQTRHCKYMRTLKSHPTRTHCSLFTIYKTTN